MVNLLKYLRFPKDGHWKKKMPNTMMIAGLSMLKKRGSGPAS